MKLSYQALVLVALSLEIATAQPAHRHEHKHKAKRDSVNYNDPAIYANVNWGQVCQNGACSGGNGGGAGSSAVSAPVATSAPAPAPASPAESASAPPAASGSPASSSAPPQASSTGSSSFSSPSGGKCNDLSSVWTSGDNSRSDMVYMGDGSACKGGCTSADGQKYTSFSGQTTPSNVGQTDGYIGNVGTQYGHNMLPLSDCDGSSYKYSLTFTNNGSDAIQAALWLKNGDDYQMPGRSQTGASRNAFFKFPLQAGEYAVFAIDDNTQLAFSQACDRNGNTGQFDCTWGEADFGNAENNAWSGYDRSSIPNGQGNTGLLTVCATGFDCSSQASHSFVSASQLNTGGNTNIPAGSAHISVAMG